MTTTPATRNDTAEAAGTAKTAGAAKTADTAEPAETSCTAGTSGTGQTCQGVLPPMSGCGTEIPRWTLSPRPGSAALEVPVPGTTVEGLRVLGVPFGTALVAAHARVLTALSGEQEVTFGRRAEPGGAARPLTLVTGTRSWRALLRQAVDTPAVQDTVDAPAARRAQETGNTQQAPDAPSFATVVELADAGEHNGPGTDTVLRVTASGDQERPVVRVRYRTNALEAEAAARIAGYHLTALARMAGEPDAPCTRGSLLSDKELRHQTHELAGPVRQLPDRRAHELFEERVRAHPDAVAVECAGARWTYRELNSRANQLARALLARGLRPEGVVAVVAERTLEWAAAVLAVLKAGGVYLPVEPRFPGRRIATTLRRAECALVLAARGSTTTLDEALPEVPGARRLLLDDAWAEEHPGTDPEIPVAAGQLAYIYFTSGSTGEPKGAMCEHAGLLNHLHAKISDLGIGPADVVAQTAPQCFDISLWQLLAALLTGGRTLLVPQEVILDVPRFVDTVADGRVAVLQVVPSYLDAVLDELTRRPRELPFLRRVSVTGEAVRKELVRRWFAARPGVPLVNAYGLTETSDDTNHEVMHGVPDTERVPLGRPIANVRVYVVDEDLTPVPLGAPGEIVFSGVCVGRGYVNDPERTRAAFTTDPHRPGERLYRSGDQGRWLPDGKLEFLGRRDTQVKIRGFRIEIGEIENTLLRMPGVRDAAVVAVADSHLVAFCTGGGDGGGRTDGEDSDGGGRSGCDGGGVGARDTVRERLAAELPAYMVPSAVHWRERLPLTANGKTDRKALGRLAEHLMTSDGRAGQSSRQDARPDAEPGGSCDAPPGTPRDAPPGSRPDAPSNVLPDALPDADAPATPAERRLAALWAELLGVPAEQVGRQGHFFDLGGTSLSAVKLAIALDRAVTPGDVLSHPVLADLARLVGTRTVTA